jgi:hypothetical protein
MISVRALLLFAAVLAYAAGASAQEGYPLTGTWYGEYDAGTQKNDLTVIMNWDGHNVSGTMNPGPTASPLSKVVLDITPGKPAAQGQNSTTGTPPIYHVRIEADAPDASGAKAPMVFEGMLMNPVAGNRRLTGTWTRGTEHGTFQLRRQ